MMETLQKMFHAWESGGWVMPALALLGIVMYSSAAHLLLKLYHRGLTKASDADLRLWVSKPEAAPKNVRELIRYTQDKCNRSPTSRDVSPKSRPRKFLTWTAASPS